MHRQSSRLSWVLMPWQVRLALPVSVFVCRFDDVRKRQDDGRNGVGMEASASRDDEDAQEQADEVDEVDDAEDERRQAACPRCMCCICRAGSFWWRFKAMDMFDVCS
ncbi:hypothetical protein E4U55_005299 [Claviceps digitariae]|nr:hypothetical protein E4U55_005299 [Claviceps digitariae]